MSTHPAAAAAGPRPTGIPRGARRQVITRAIIATLFALIIAVAARGFAEYLFTPARVQGDMKSYGLNSATVHMAPQRDGSVRVDERIEFDFDGSFSGAYRDIPMRPGDSINDVVVCSEGTYPATPTSFAGSVVPGGASAPQDLCPDGTTAMSPGGNTMLGSSDAPERFGTVQVREQHGNSPTQDYMRIVWHYNAFSTQRAFHVVYRARGWMERPSDGGVVVLNAVPWGDEWGATLEQLAAHVDPPRGVTDAKVDLIAAGSGSSRVRIRRTDTGAGSTQVVAARNVAPGERVDVMATMPDSFLARDADVRESERSLKAIQKPALAEQRSSHERAAAAVRAEERATWIILGGALLGLLVGSGWTWFWWRHRFAESPWPADVPEYLSEPPTVLPPALAAALVGQHESTPDTALLATIFDLIRRKQWRIFPADGGKRGTRIDIALAPLKGGRTEALQSGDLHAARLVDEIIGTEEHGVPMGGFRKRLKKDWPLTENVQEHEANFTAAVDADIAGRGWYQPAGVGLRLGLPGVLMLLVGGGLAAFAISQGRFEIALAVYLVALAVLLGSCGIVLLISAISRELRVRWTDDARHLAAQWTAYYHHLDHYGDMEDEQTASIELWEQHLVYAVAFGCADDILDSVRPSAGTAADEDSFAAAPLIYVQPWHYSTFSTGIATRAPDPTQSSSSGFGGGGGGFGGGRRAAEVAAVPGSDVELCLGGNVFGWTIDEAQSFAVLDAFRDAGGRFIDTADVYSSWAPGNRGGESERIIGRWLASRGGRDEMRIATKVGAPMPDGTGLSREWIRAAVEASRRRLGVETIDLLYAHRDDRETPLDETLGAFDELVQLGHVRQLGASNYDAARLEEALGISAADGLASFEVLQPYYNLLERDTFEGELQQACIDHHIKVAPYYALASGFLTGKYSRDGELPSSPRAHGAMRQYGTERGWMLLDAVRVVAGRHGATAAQVSIAWLVTRDAVFAPIASATSVDQLVDLLAFRDLELSDADLQLLESPGEVPV